MARFKFTNHFFRNLKKLPQNEQNLFWEKIKLFENDIFHPKLKTHKLKGYQNCWAFSINFSNRVIFRLEKNTVTFLKIGDHGIYEY